MTSKKAFIALFCGLFLSLHAHGEVLFESFYRLERNNRHTGYLIQRLSSDAKGNKLLSTYIRSRVGDRESYTAVKSVAKAGKGSPIETTHVSNSSGAPYKIHAQFKNGKATIGYHSNNARKAGSVETASNPAYPSAFMFYLADLGKFQPGKKYSYTAFFEENGRNQVGQLSLLGAKDAAGKRVFQLLNDDSGQPIESFVAENGDPLGSRSISTGTVCFWVATKEEAIGDMTYPTGEMTALFGDIPTGKKNLWSKSPNFKAVDIIQSFTTWDGSRSLTSPPAAQVLPLPVRSL